MNKYYIPDISKYIKFGKALTFFNKLSKSHTLLIISNGLIPGGSQDISKYVKLFNCIITGIIVES